MTRVPVGASMKRRVKRRTSPRLMPSRASRIPHGRSTAVLDETAGARQLAVFPENRAAAVLDCEAVQIGVTDVQVRGPRQWRMLAGADRVGSAVDVAAPMVREAQAQYRELRACSFNRGFHSPDNRIKLDALLDLNVLPTKGYLSRADRERASADGSNPAISGLEHRGFDRVRNHGADGFARTVALSVLAANLHPIGLILQKRERKRRRCAA